MTRDGIAITIIAVGVVAVFMASIVRDSLPSLPHTWTVSLESDVAVRKFVFPRGLPRSAHVLDCKSRVSPVGGKDLEQIVGCSISIDAQDFPGLVKDFVQRPVSEVAQALRVLPLAEMPRVVEVHTSSHWELGGCFIYSDASKTRLAVFRQGGIVVN